MRRACWSVSVSVSIVCSFALSLSLSLDRTLWRNLHAGEPGSSQTAREGVPPCIAAAAIRNASRRVTAPPPSFVVASRGLPPMRRRLGRLLLEPHGFEGPFGGCTVFVDLVVALHP